MRWIPYLRLYSCYNCKQEVFTKPQPLLLKDPSAERFWEHTTIKPTDSRNLSTLEANSGKAP